MTNHSIKIDDNLSLLDIGAEVPIEVGGPFTWDEVEECGTMVGNLKEGDAFAAILADKGGFKLTCFTGVVVRVGMGSVSVQIERGWDNDVVTWAPETKVVPLPKVQQ